MHQVLHHHHHHHHQSTTDLCVLSAASRSPVASSDLRFADKRTNERTAVKKDNILLGAIYGRMRCIVQEWFVIKCGRSAPEEEESEVAPKAFRAERTICG